MWLNDNWTDYELIDCSDGERLERWGDFILIRPDPQVIWKTPRSDPRWRNPSARYIRSTRGGGAWERFNLPDSWSIGYRNLRFNIKPMNFKHTGIFPEQAVNWEFIDKRIKASGRELSVLNLFAYTGAATLAAAAAGASVCHVDAAKGMVSWARENAEASSVSSKPIRWIVDDCRAFIEREIRRGRFYDAIIMDPPSYGRGPSGEISKLEDDLYNFVLLCSRLLSERPSFVLLNSYTTGLSASVLTYICESVFSAHFGGESISDELGLPVTGSGLILPCGSSCRWTLG